MFSYRIWDFWAPRYESLLVQQLVLTPVRNAVLKDIQLYLEKRAPMAGVDILDIGCGTGQLIREMESALSEFHPRITGVDISREMLHQARQKPSKAVYVCADAETYKPAGCRYDVIVCLNAFPYCRNHDIVLANLYAMLKKGGILILAQASINTLYDRLVLLWVKLTVSRSRYLSIRQINSLSQKAIGTAAASEKIPVRWYVPSIIKFVWRKPV